MAKQARTGQDVRAEVAAQAGINDAEVKGNAEVKGIKAPEAPQPNQAHDAAAPAASSVPERTASNRNRLANNAFRSMKAARRLSVDDVSRAVGTDVVESGTASPSSEINIAARASVPSAQPSAAAPSDEAPVEPAATDAVESGYQQTQGDGGETSAPAKKKSHHFSKRVPERDNRIADQGKSLGRAPSAQELLDQRSADPDAFRERTEEMFSPKLPVETDREDVREYPTTRASKSEEQRRKVDPKAVVSQKFFKGAAVYGKVTSDRSVPVDHISIGDEVVKKLSNLPNSGFLRYLSDQLGTDLSNMLYDKIVELIESSSIRVGVFKSPNLEPESACQVYLSVHKGSDIRLHPVAAKRFNADFDGDDVCVSFKESSVKRLPNPMRFLINIAGDLTIDDDFMPKYIPALGIVNEAHRREAYEQFRDHTTDMRGLNRRNREKLADLMADMYFAIDTDENDHAREDATRAFAVGLGEVFTGRSGYLGVDRIGELLTRYYDDARMLEMMHANPGGKSLISDLPKPRNLSDYRLYTFTESLLSDSIVRANGRGAMNFQDLKAIMCEYLGEPAKKNPSFRFTANIAKLFVNFDTRIQIGSEAEVGAEELLSGVLRFVESRKIRNAVFLSENARTQKEAVRGIMLGTDRNGAYSKRSLEKEGRRGAVGLPSDYGSFAEFANTFTAVYRRNQAFINSANITVNTDMSISKSGEVAKADLFELGENPDAKDFAKVLLDIYGDVSKGSSFFTGINFRRDEYGRRHAGEVDASGRTVREKSEWSGGDVNAIFGSRTLRELSHENKFWISGAQLAKYSTTRQYIIEDRVDENGEVVVDPETGEPEKAKYLNPDFERAVLMSIINIRSSAASKYSTAVYGKNSVDRGKVAQNGAKEEVGTKVEDTVMYKLLQTLKSLDVQLGRSRDELDWNAWVTDLVNLVNEVNPDVFAHFNMDNPRGFFSSRFGEALMDVARRDIDKRDAVELLGSIHMAMVTEYRMAKVEAERAKVNKALSDVNCSVEALQRLIDAQHAEESVLASSSAVWRTVVKELRTSKADSVFTKLKNGETLGMMYFDFAAANPGGGKASRWTDGSLDKYDSVLDVLLDTELTMSEKSTILADVTRIADNFFYLNSFEVPFQLASDPSSSYSTLPPTSEGIMSVVNEFNDSFRRYSKRSRKAMQRQIDEAYENYGNTSGKLIGALQFYADHPEFYVDIDEMSYADALCSTLDKVYAQSEKSKQHPWTNAMYVAMSYVRNLGLFSDVYRTDDRPLGLLPADAVSPHDIVRVLADPALTLHAYNDSGEVVRLNRDNLVGVENADEADIWRFLRANPRIASCLRVHRPCVIEEKGSGFLGAQSSISDAIGKVSSDEVVSSLGEKLVKYNLYDDPSYGALVALCVPTHGRSSRTMRNAYHAVDVALRNEIQWMAVESVSSLSVAEKIKCTAADFKAAGVMPDEAERLETLVVKSLDRFSNTVLTTLRESNLILAPDSIKPSAYSFPGPDLEACHAYYDARQELSGSKTAVSTGVEGHETWKLAAFIATLRPEDRYTDIGTIVDVESLGHDELVQRFGECMTSKGVKLSMLGESDFTDDVIVQTPPDFTVPDKTLDRKGRQVSSACAYLIVKRDSGAEKFNLKAKKTGDDGLHSVTKHGKYYTDEEAARFEFQSTGYDDLLEKVNEIYHRVDPETETADAARNLFDAKMFIARRIKQANEMCGYNEMTLANCMCIADLMVIDNGAGGLRLRSLSMIAKAIKSRMSYSLIDTGNADDFHKVAVDAAATAGVVTDDVASIMSKIRPATKVLDKTSIVRPRSSSWETNWKLLNEIARELDAQSETEIGSLEDRVVPVSGTIERSRLDKDGIKKAVKDKKLEIPGLWKIGDKEIKNIIRKGFNPVGYNSAVNMQVGPSNLTVIDKADDQTVGEVMREAWRHGSSVAISSETLFNTETGRMHAPDAVPFPEWPGFYLIPFFDLRLNGSESVPSEPTFGIFKRPKDNIVWSVEDYLNEFSLGDAAIQFFRSFVDRIKVNWSDTTMITAANLFPNVLASFPDAQFSVRLSTAEEVEDVLNPRSNSKIDIGVSPEGRGFDQHYMITMDAIDRYREESKSFLTVNDAAGLRADAEPGDVVGWATIEIYPKDSVRMFKAYAPIIPFDLQGTNGVSQEAIPSKFHISSIDFNRDTTPKENAVVIDWKYSDDILGHTLKFFEGQGTANKMVGAANTAADDRTFRNGVKIDAFYARESTASRRIGTNKRMGTLQTLMLMARTEGYNFAKTDGSFPSDNEANRAIEEKLGIDIKETLIGGYIPTSMWRQIVDEGVVWHSDEKINNFLNVEMRKWMANGGNPTDYLCSQFETEDGTADTDIWWEFECMFSATDAYQDQLMRFLHSMNPKLCAESIDDSSEGHLFRCMPCDGKDPFSTHCMAMEVPHRDPRGGWYYNWENVYAGWSFINFNDFSGAHKINVNGSSDALDAVATLALANRIPSMDEYRAWLRSAMSDVGEFNQVQQLVEIDGARPFNAHAEHLANGSGAVKVETAGSNEESNQEE